MSNLVSIVVPCYNQAHFLNEALQSVLSQTYKNWECIIVNDGSPDDTDMIAQQWCESDNRFKYLEKINGGLSSARNAGVKKCSGKYIVALDADDILRSDFLEKMIPALDKDESLGIVSCYTKFFTGEIENTIGELRPKGNNYKYLLYVNQLVATSVYRKKCWEKVGGYDENLMNGFEDWEFWISITKSGWNYYVLKDFLFLYRKSKNSMLTKTNARYFDEVREYIFKKHRDLYKEDFDNCLTVLFFELKQQRMSKAQILRSVEYRIGNFILFPFRLIQKLFY